MITDDELLAACRSAGEPGSESHRDACRLYRRAVAEQRDGALTALRQLVALVAETAGLAGLLGGCGTPAGYSRHCRERTLICGPCREAETAYRQGQYRARVAAGRGQPLREAA